MASIWDEPSIWDDDYTGEEEVTPTAAPVEEDEDDGWLRSIQPFIPEEDEYTNLRKNPDLEDWVPPTAASITNVMNATTAARADASNNFAGIFRNEGAKTGQPTNLNSSAVGRGQMIKGTREAMYKKLGFTDFKNAEQRFRTEPEFEMQVMNAYRGELDARIPSHVQGRERERMIAKGWYTGDPFYDDDKVPGRSAGNRMTAGQYADRAVRQYGGFAQDGLNNMPEIPEFSSEAMQEYLDAETSPIDEYYYPPQQEESPNRPSALSRGLYSVMNGVDKFKQVKDKLNSVGVNAAQSVSAAIDMQTEIAGVQRNASTMRKFNADKNLKKYTINKTPLNQPLIYT